MKSKMTKAVGLLGAFVAGMLVATALGGGIAGAGTTKYGTVRQGQQVVVERVISSTVTDEDIALLRQDLRQKKMQVIGQNMSLSDNQAEKLWPKTVRQM